MNSSRMRLRKIPKSFWIDKKIHKNPKLKGHSNGLPEREVHSDAGLTKKESNISNK